MNGEKKLVFVCDIYIYWCMTDNYEVSDGGGGVFF